MKLYFATGNKHKLNEVQRMLRVSLYDIRSMHELGFTGDIEETGKTLDENALIKAQFIQKEYGVDVFGEDTGLEVDALDGAPGIRTARYAGEEKDAEKNMELLLENLKEHSNRNARFRTSIALILDGKQHLFEGFVNGTIAKEIRGERGFGYDPIFIPNGYNKTFAELSDQIKDSISHRFRAMSKLVSFLKITSKNPI